MRQQRFRRRRLERNEVAALLGTSAVRVLVAVTALLSSVVSTDVARAGTYVMRNCDVPGHANSLLGPWQTYEMQPNAMFTDACANGGGVVFSIVGVPQMSGGGWATLGLLKPASGPQSAITFVKAVLWYAARLDGTGAPINLSSIEIHGDSTNRPGVSNGPPGAENLVLEQQFDPQQTVLYKVGVVCGPPFGQTCFPAAAAPLQIRGMEVTLNEDVQPLVSPPSGTLLEDGPQSGIRTLTYSASDAQSGLARVDVMLDDTLVASRDLTPRCPAVDFTVCPAAQDETLDIDTRSVPNGSHSLTVRVRDAAGNERLVTGARPVVVANPASPGSAPVYTLTANFRGSSRSSLTVPYGRRVSLRGRLTGLHPTPAGTEIEVLERVDRRGARELSAGRVSTTADGSFSYALRTDRASRTVRLAYRPAVGVESVSRSLKLRIRAGSSLHASLRGRVIHFGGRVRSGPIPEGGLRIRMEGRAPGSAWTSFANLRTTRKGGFSGTYRLPIRRPGVKLRIRAFVLTKDGYPYLSSRSGVVTLRVR
jgi:hypothetical protein